MLSESGTEAINKRIETINKKIELFQAKLDKNLEENEKSDKFIYDLAQGNVAEVIAVTVNKPDLIQFALTRLPEEYREEYFNKINSQNIPEDPITHLIQYFSAISHYPAPELQEKISPLMTTILNNNIINILKNPFSQLKDLRPEIQVKFLNTISDLNWSRLSPPNYYANFIAFNLNQAMPELSANAKAVYIQKIGGENALKAFVDQPERFGNAISILDPARQSAFINSLGAEKIIQLLNYTDEPVGCFTFNRDKKLLDIQKLNFEKMISRHFSVDGFEKILAYIPQDRFIEFINKNNFSIIINLMSADNKRIFLNDLVYEKINGFISSFEDIISVLASIPQSEHKKLLDAVGSEKIYKILNFVGLSELTVSKLLASIAVDQRLYLFSNMTQQTFNSVVRPHTVIAILDKMIQADRPEFVKLLLENKFITTSPDKLKDILTRLQPQQILEVMSSFAPNELARTFPNANILYNTLLGVPEDKRIDFLDVVMLAPSIIDWKLEHIVKFLEIYHLD